MLTVVAVLWAGAAVAQAQDEPVAREQEQLLARLDRLREEAAATEARAKALGEEMVNLAGDEAKLRQRLEESSASVAALEQRIADDEVELERLTDDQSRLRQELAGKRVELATVLAALQRIGRRPPPALLADSGSATDTVRGAILLNAVLPTLDEGARTLARTVADAARLAAEERVRWASLRQDLGTLTEERAKLEDVGEELERRRALSTYERDRATADLARLAEEETSVSALLDRLARGGAGATPQAPGFAARRGTLPEPVAGAVVAQYGEPTGAGGISEGRTIAALPQSTVFAPMNATVLFSAPFRGYGHVLILDAGEGYHMVLAGLESSSVAPGDTVGAGNPVGRMGRSGSRSAVASAGVKGSALLGARPALYIELRRDGSAIDSHGWWQETVADVGRTGG